jgi:hypothetical protein
MKPIISEKATAELYAGILEEIKHRINAINTGTNNQIPVPAPLVREFCYLQIRMICELIALGCLLVHGDIEATQKASLQKEWSAEAIINALSKLHSDFFPLAARQVQSDKVVGGKPVYAIDIINPPIMTKQELLDLYGRCGGILHRGNLRKLHKQQIPTQMNNQEIAAIGQKLHDLLALHTIVMLGGKKVFLCILRNSSDNMKAQVSTAAGRTLPESTVPPQKGGP